MFARPSGSSTCAKLMWSTVVGGLALHHQVIGSYRSRICVSAFPGELEPPPLDVPLLITRMLYGRRPTTEVGNHGRARGEDRKLGLHLLVVLLTGGARNSFAARVKPRWFWGLGISHPAIVVPHAAIPEPVAFGLKRANGRRHHAALAAVEDRHKAVDGQVRWGTGKHRDDHAH